MDDWYKTDCEDPSTLISSSSRLNFALMLKIIIKGGNFADGLSPLTTTGSRLSTPYTNLNYTDDHKIKGLLTEVSLEFDEIRLKNIGIVHSFQEFCINNGIV